jgi:hypothetical protein
LNGRGRRKAKRNFGLANPANPAPGKFKFNKNKGKSKTEPDEEAEAALSADMRESEAVMDPRERRKLQTQILEAMFEVYFRILKMGKGMAVALLPSTFAGLAKFSHLISIDFLGDLLVALQVGAPTQRHLSSSQFPPLTLTLPLTQARRDTVGFMTWNVWRGNETCD